MGNCESGNCESGANISDNVNNMMFNAISVYDIDNIKLATEMGCCIDEYYNGLTFFHWYVLKSLSNNFNKIVQITDYLKTVDIDLDKKIHKWFIKIEIKDKQPLFSFDEKKYKDQFKYKGTNDIRTYDYDKYLSRYYIHKKIYGITTIDFINLLHVILMNIKYEIPDMHIGNAIKNINYIRDNFIKGKNLVKLNDDMLCAICYEEKINMIMKPCKHSNICRKCCEAVNKCPFCNSEIVSKESFFI